MIKSIDQANAQTFKTFNVTRKTFVSIDEPTTGWCANKKENAKKRNNSGSHLLLYSLVLLFTTILTLLVHELSYCTSCELSLNSARFGLKVKVHNVIISKYV